MYSQGVFVHFLKVLALSFPGRGFDDLETAGNKISLWLIGDKYPCPGRNKEPDRHIGEKTEQQNSTANYCRIWNPTGLCLLYKKRLNVNSQ